MLVSKLIDNNNIFIRDKYLELCEEGIRRMQNSKDANHDHHHIWEILELLEKLLENEEKLDKNDIDFELLLPAICWHDVWMSYRKQTTNIISLLYERVYEGLGSSRIFNKYIESSNKNYKKSDDIAKIIFFHAEYKFLPFINFFKRRYDSPELEILRDLDTITSVSTDRIDRLIDHYMCKSNTDPLLFRAAFFYVKRITLKKSKTHLHYDFSKEVYQNRRKDAIKKMVDVLEKLLNNKEYYFDPNNTNFRYVKYFDPDVSSVRAELDEKN